MKLSSNIIRFYDQFGINGMLDLFSEVGIEAVDFNCDILEFHDASHDKNYYEDVRKYANDKGIVFGQSHAPFASAYVDNALSEKRFYEIVKSMEISSYLAAPCMVVHPCQHFDF